jgi:Pyruvate/2-oxoacid:ferredoxin oxidoreductase gamma subunit
MLGALAGSGVLPIPGEAFKETIRTKMKEKLVEVNLRAFDLGFGAL